MEYKVPTSGLDQFFNFDEIGDSIEDIDVSLMDDFPNHPFRVSLDDKQIRLIDSMKQNGQITPVILRKMRNGRYQILSGHCRKAAAQFIGMKSLKAKVIDGISDDEATVIMVDSNFQREGMLISEKAKSFKMRYEAMKRQGKRTDLENVITDETFVLLEQKREHTAEMISNAEKMSSSKLRRYCRLSNLSEELLSMVDDKELNINAAADYISYLSGKNQAKLYKVLTMHNIKVNIQQSRKLKEMGEKKELSEDEMLMILEPNKKKQPSRKIELSEQELHGLIDVNIPDRELKLLIIRLLKAEKEKEKIEVLMNS